MASPALSPLYVRHLVAYLRTAGADPEALYGTEMIQRYAQAEVSSRHPVHEWDAMVARAEAATGDEALLLTLAEFLKPWDVGAIGFISMASPTLRQAFEALATFYGVLNDAYSLALIGWHARWLAGQPRLIFDADFAFPAPLSHSAATAYSATFGGELAFG